MHSSHSTLRRNGSHIALSISLLLSSLSLFEPLQGWIISLATIAVMVRLALALHLQKLPPSMRTLNLLAVLSALALAYFGWQLGLLLAMVNLLILAAALKLMAIRTERDYFQLVTVVLFVIGCGFIFNQSIAYSVFYWLLTFSVLLSLALYISPSLPLTFIFKLLSKLCLIALPIAIMLFLLLPQIGPLWQLPTAKGAQTGLSEKISPGDIARLSQSSDLAFRASFEGAMPDPTQRYWRTIVMEHFDGHSWQIHPQRKRQQERYLRANQVFDIALQGPYFDYKVIAEPSHQHWLYALDIGSSNDPRVWQNQDYTLTSKRPLQSTMQYVLRSYYQQPLDQGLYQLDHFLNLQLPTEGNPQTQQWVANLRAQHPQNGAFIAALNSYFTGNNFKYTLKPSPMPVDMVDRFLFDYQAGFCAHYASAMAYSLRLGGIPARVVTGYLGGERHEGNYFSVYQYDAHAWVEAWLDGKGWVRYDPTSLVSPERQLYGLERAVAYENTFLSDQRFALVKLKSIAWLNQLRLQLAELDFLWSRWVLGFDQQQQRDLLKQLLGQLTPHRIMLFTFACFMGVLLSLSLYYFRHWWWPQTDQRQRYYRQALSLLAKSKIHRDSTLGPQAFSQHVNEHYPATISAPFMQITNDFINVLYAGKTQQSTKQLKQQLRRLRAGLRKFKRS
ncbi:DUF3488 and DUF4129 domain-containing transglutaminase family protein [Alteromonadaceae bacterium BrNp21-10]|nr:DUF3488 and DUF4129 domain-containing transglutaminase family protein [Alteromonadaceae bacterium BrNp21-10]